MNYLVMSQWNNNDLFFAKRETIHKIKIMIFILIISIANHQQI